MLRAAGGPQVPTDGIGRNPRPQAQGFEYTGASDRVQLLLHSFVSELVIWGSGWARGFPTSSVKVLQPAVQRDTLLPEQEGAERDGRLPPPRARAGLGTEIPLFVWQINNSTLKSTIRNISRALFVLLV